MKMLKMNDSVVVFKNNTMKYGRIVLVREMMNGTLYTVCYRDDEDTFYRSYYGNDPTVVIEKDDEVYA
jgi:hypothetical protein